jgi:hypothetical protein
MLGICFLAFCLGQGSPEPSGRATFTHDIRNPSRTEQIVAYDNRWVVAGFVHQSAGDDAAFIGTLPLTVSMLGGRLSFDGGAILASSTVPRAGTHANFMARVQLRVTNRLDLAYWHWSNGNLGDHNPSVDAVGLSVRMPSWGGRARGSRRPSPPS